MRDDDSRRSRITLHMYEYLPSGTLASHRHALTGNRIPSMVLGGTSLFQFPSTGIHTAMDVMHSLVVYHHRYVPYGQVQ